MELIFVAGIGIAVLIEFLLITKRGKTGPDRVLTVWMFVVLFHLFLFYLFYRGDFLRYPFLLGIDFPIPLVHGVFLFIYASYLTDQLPRKRSFLLLHFAPAAAMYVYLTGFFILPDEEKIRIYQSKGAGYETFSFINQLCIALSGVVYVAWTSVILKRHRKNIGDQYSNTEKINLRWLRFLTIGLGGIWVLVLFSPDSNLHFLGVVFYIFLIGFFGIRQAGVFHHGGSPLEESEDTKKKYPKSGLTSEQAELLHASLKELMEKESMHRRNDLSIGDLASRLNVHPNYLSQVINEKEGMNFYDFVNTYRIEEFKKLAADPRNRNKTLLSLAFDCGFNSKSSFNRYFKRTTGQTPSEYFSTFLGNS